MVTPEKRIGRQKMSVVCKIFRHKWNEGTGKYKGKRYCERCFKNQKLVSNDWKYYDWGTGELICS